MKSVKLSKANIKKINKVLCAVQQDCEDLEGWEFEEKYGMSKKSFELIPTLGWTTKTKFGYKIES